jgi:uncharacterized protein
MPIQEKLGGVLILCQIQPRASKTEVMGLHGEPQRIRIRIAAPPVDGKANEALIAFLAKRLGIPKRAIEIHSGQTGKMKDIICYGVGLEEVKKALLG